jgi:hypothetical protein
MKGMSLGVVVLAGVAQALAGCGGSSSSSGVAHISSAPASATGNSAATGDGSSPESANPEQAALAYSHCMRSHGVPNFPDPKSGGGLFRVGGGINSQSPSFRSAQAKCQKLMGGGPGSGPPPSTQTLARFLRISQCMRKYGVPEFPDPRTTVPPNLHPPAGAHTFVISDIEGVILVMGSIDTQSPAFMRAAAACAFPLHNH